MERRMACKDVMCVLVSSFFGYGFSDKETLALGAVNNGVRQNQNLEENIQGHYARQIIGTETHDVINPEYALGKPDQNYALIKPGGELALKMEKPFSVMKFGGIGGRTSSGTISEKECDYAVAVLVPTEEGKDKTEYAWRWLPPSSVPGGLYMVTGGQVKVDALKIINNAKDLDLGIDFVVGY
jgi:hypothetical protein